MGLFDTLFGNKTDVEGLVAQGAKIVDVRTPQEFQGGHVNGSINIPLNTIVQQADKIKSWNVPVILCCASGNRSGMATRQLKGHGIDCYNGGSWLDVNGKV